MAWWLVLLLFSVDLYIVRAVDYKLDGKSYIIYSPSAKFSKPYSTIHMLFRTAEDSGVLLHARGTNGDFITLEIVRGKLRYASVFGRGDARSGTHDVIIGDDLGDDQWHQIDIERNKYHVKIILDITRKYLTAERVQKYQNITVAGLPLSINNHTSLPPVSLTGSTFKGCMEDATFNKINIFKAIKEKSKDVSVLGKLWRKCTDDAEYYPPATLSTSNSYIKLAPVNGQDINFKFKFRTFDHTGVLVHYSFSSSTTRKLFLELLHGQLMFNYAFQNLNINTIISTKYITYADGLWHNVQLNLTSKGVAIQVNNETSQKLLNSSAQFKNLFQNPMLKIGTGLKDKPSMKGCVREIQLNGKDIEVTSSMSQEVALDQCYLTDLCFISPCLHQGVCQQHNSTIRCDCTNTGYSGSRCQNISKIKSVLTNKPNLTTSSVMKTIPKSLKQGSTVRSSTITPDKLPITLRSFTKLKTIHTTQNSNLEFLKNLSQISTAFTVKPSQFISPITKQTSSGQLNGQPMTPTSTQILTGKPKPVITTTNKKIFTKKPKQFTTSKSKQTLPAPTKQSLPPTRTQTLITQLTQNTTSLSKLNTTDQVKQVTTPASKLISTIQVKQSMARKKILTKPNRTTVQPEQSITPITTTIPITSPSTIPLDQPTQNLTLSTGQKPTTHSTLFPQRPTQRLTLPTAQNPTHKINTQIIVIEKPNTITKVGFNKHQLLVYLFLFIVFLLFVGLIIIISVKMSYLNVCSCLRRFHTVNGSLPSQDSIELGHQQRKDSTSAVRVKTDRPSSLNDSGIDRSESGNDSHRSSAEVQDDAIRKREDLGLGDHVDLETSPDDPTEGFLILQEEPSLYTQKSFGWTILSSSNTIRHCRTSTRDLIHAANDNKPPAFRPAYYPHSEISDDVRVDAEDDVSGDVIDTRYNNSTTKYRQLATSNCSSLDNVSIDIEQCNSLGVKRNSGAECSV